MVAGGEQALASPEGRVRQVAVGAWPTRGTHALPSPWARMATSHVTVLPSLHGELLGFGRGNGNIYQPPWALPTNRLRAPTN